MKCLYRAYIFLILINSLAKCIDGFKPKYVEHANSYDTDYYNAGWEDSEMENQKLPEECKTLQYFVMRRICTELYPEDIKETYMDDFVEANNQYAVFAFDDEGVEHHFLTFQHSALFNCYEIEVRDLINFICRNSTGGSEDVKLRNGLMQCLDHPSSMVDELLVACSPNLNKSTTFTALHYSNFIPGERSNSEARASTVMHWWLWQAFAMLALVCCCCKIFD